MAVNVLAAIFLDMIFIFLTHFAAFYKKNTFFSRNFT